MKKKIYTNREIHNIFLDFLSQGRNSKGTDYNKDIEDRYLTKLDDAIRYKYLEIINKKVKNDMDTEDIYQKAIIILNDRKDGFDPAQNISFNTWFESTILKYLILSYQRDKSREKEKPFSSYTNTNAHSADCNGNLFLENIASGDNFEHDILLVEKLRIIRHFINKIEKDIYKDTIVFYFFGGYTLKGIAEIMRVPLNTVKTRITRGKRELFKIFNKFYMIRKMNKDISNIES